jgi:very-short-patch-repair endonuclease
VNERTERKRFFTERAGLYRDRVPGWKFKAAKQMRKAQTPAEEVLWDRLRGQALGVRVRRQAVALGYILDFWISSWRVAIEVDGGYHSERVEEDRLRDERLRSIGIRVIRFTNERVLYETDAVVNEIARLEGA